MAVYGYNSNFWLDRRTGTIPSTYPFTIAAWVNYKNTGVTFPTFLTLTNRSTAVNYAHFYAANDNLFHYEINGNVDYSSGSAGAATVGTWYHLALVAPNNITTLYLNGAVANSGNSGVTTLTGMNTIGIGSLVTSTNHYYAADDGLAYVGVWNIDLSAADVLTLSKGFSPRQVRPEKLVSFADLLAQNTTAITRDWVSGPFTLTGSSSTGPYPAPRVRR